MDCIFPWPTPIFKGGGGGRLYYVIELSVCRFLWVYDTKFLKILVRISTTSSQILTIDLNFWNILPLLEQPTILLVIVDVNPPSPSRQPAKREKSCYLDQQRTEQEEWRDQSQWWESRLHNKIYSIVFIENIQNCKAWNHDFQKPIDISWQFG